MWAEVEERPLNMSRRPAAESSDNSPAPRTHPNRGISMHLGGFRYHAVQQPIGTVVVSSNDMTMSAVGSRRLSCEWTS